MYFLLFLLFCNPSDFICALLLRVHRLKTTAGKYVCLILYFLISFIQLHSSRCGPVLTSDYWDVI